jgi:hypothetical protein
MQSVLNAIIVTSDPTPDDCIVTGAISHDVRPVAWRLLTATGAGAIVGATVGGIGGRLAMFGLRLTSDDRVLGLTTDDGFEIGQFTTATLFLLTVTAGLGAATGATYFVVREALPKRGRTLLWATVVGLFTGADLLKPQSLDFTLLNPKSFAVASFVLLPIVAAFLIAFTLERLLVLEPWSSRPLTVVLVLGALPLIPVLPVLLLLFGATLLFRRRPRIHATTLAFARFVVPLFLIALAARSGVDLWHDAHEILNNS